jgi:hypothetical protein
MNGGVGNDTAIFSGNAADYTVFYNTVTDVYLFMGSDGTYTVTGVESFQFDDVTATTANLFTYVVPATATVTLSDPIAYGVDTGSPEARTDGGGGILLSRPDTVALADGGYVVTWTSYNQDGSHAGIRAQLYNADGTMNGSEFQVNTYTSSVQRYPSITDLSDGGFLITWESFGQDGSDYGIYAQRYDANGTRNGTEFRVNTYNYSGQMDPYVTSLADGGFVVTWESNVQDGSGYGIYAQRYHADGTKNGSEFKVNTYSTSWQTDSEVAALADGGFVVTWGSSGQDNSTWGVYAQRYNADGTKNGSEFKVNTYGTLSQWEPSIEPLSDGGFVIAWRSDGQDGSAAGVYAQKYHSDGTPNGSEFQVNTYTAGYQGSIDITALSDGGFVVVWQSDGQDGSGYGRVCNGAMIELSGKIYALHNSFSCNAKS